MRTFQDNAGRTWTVAVTVDAVKRVRDLLKEDLLDIERVFPRLFVDPILLCDVVYCVCKPQADAQQVSDVDFGRAMAGDAIAHAEQALVEELVDFFHDPNHREVARRAIRKYSQFRNRVAEAVIAHLESPTLAQQLEAILKTACDSFTNSPESSESIPGH